MLGNKSRKIINRDSAIVLPSFSLAGYIFDNLKTEKFLVNPAHLLRDGVKEESKNGRRKIYP
jgi:hypothetical protein